MKTIIWCITIVACLSSATNTPAQSTDLPRNAAGNESLGNELLEGLGAGAMTTNPASPPDSHTKPEAPGVELPPELRLRQPVRFDDLGLGLGTEGEDLGAPSGPLPLVRARQNMEQASALLTQQAKFADVRTAQDRVVAHLDELINGLCKQCQGGGNPNPNPQQASQQPKPKPAGGARPGLSAIAPRGASEEPQPPREARTERAEREELVKRLWGHLPERAREQMLQSYSGEFLPEYELELEKYYRRLAEEPEIDRAK
jgi:hypothetical protein